jgi:starch synthase
MSKKKVLIVTQEMDPYSAASEMAEITRRLSQYIQDNGMEIRVLMPRFGSINERRHRLHEVVRLSGMNIIVDDDDFPLIIKVASLPEARMQVYFLDNEDFFRRKGTFEDENGQPYEDNADRVVFFCKGAIETVKKFGWSPDIVHCHGWMTSLIPLYLKTAYKLDPIFQDAKVVYSIYAESFENKVSDNFLAKATINNLTAGDLGAYQNGAGVTIQKGAIAFSDAIILGSENVEDAVQKMAYESNKPVLAAMQEDYTAAYMDFYHSLLAAKVSD